MLRINCIITPADVRKKEGRIKGREDEEEDLKEEKRKDTGNWKRKHYLFYIEFSQLQHKTTIMFTATCFDSKESSSGYVRTTYVYKVTVRMRTVTL